MEEKRAEKNSEVSSQIIPGKTNESRETGGRGGGDLNREAYAFGRWRLAALRKVLKFKKSKR